MQASAQHEDFDTLVCPHLDGLFRFACWLTRDAHAAEEVLQETLMRAWRSLHKLETPGASKSWLITTLRRENARRFERKRFQTVDIDDCQVAETGHASPDEALATDEFRRALLDLPESYREPLALQVLMGFSVAEIARAMDLSESAVMTRLFRARKQLKHRLQEEENLAA